MLCPMAVHVGKYFPKVYIGPQELMTQFFSPVSIQNVPGTLIDLPISFQPSPKMLSTPRKYAMPPQKSLTVLHVDI